jgi:hypothetical protein
MSDPRFGARQRAVWAVALGVAAVLATTPQSASARATQAQKVALTQTNRSCAGVVLDDVHTQVLGSAVVTKAASGKLLVSVSLADASPGTTYAIRVIQVLPGDTDCHRVAGYLTTDSTGAGQAAVQEPTLPGASQVWVDLNATDDFTNYLDGELISF